MDDGFVAMASLPDFYLAFCVAFFLTFWINHIETFFSVTKSWGP